MTRRPIFPYYRKCAHKFDFNAPAVFVEGLTASYAGLGSIVLDHISFHIAKGERVALLGVNGAGKSTLLKSLVGIIPSISGTIRLLGHPVAACQHHVTYLSQRSEIDWGFPVSLYKLVLSGSYIHQGWFKRPTQEQKDLAYSALRRLKIDHLAQRQIGQLSVGQQQRGLLARALVQKAEVYLLDEPFNAVDEETKDIIKEVFLQLQKEGKTLFVATHDKDHLKDFFDRALILEDSSTLREVSI